MNNPVTGPLYAETDLSRFPVEPWNTYSNIVFFLLVIYWWRKTRIDPQNHQLIRTCLPILLLGFVGGTVWHATRASRLWLMLDYLPIFLATLTAAVFFWAVLLRNRPLAAVVVLGSFGLISLSWQFSGLPFLFKIGLSYSTLTAVILLPALLLCARDNWRGATSLFSAIILISIAIFMRQIDLTLGHEMLPMGTHFLWHILGGIAVYFLINFIYQTRIETSPFVLKHT